MYLKKLFINHNFNIRKRSNKIFGCFINDRNIFLKKNLKIFLIYLICKNNN